MTTKKPSHYIIVENKRSWFSQPRVVYKVMEWYTYWDDPSYGNGGGAYRDAVRCVATCSEEQEALNLLETFLRYPKEGV